MFCLSELTKKNQEYSQKVDAPKVSKDAVYELAWQIDELTSMRNRYLSLSRELHSLFTPGLNLPLQMTKIRDELKYLADQSSSV